VPRLYPAEGSSDGETGWLFGPGGGCQASTALLFATPSTAKTTPARARPKRAAIDPKKPSQWGFNIGSHANFAAIQLHLDLSPLDYNH
jgi:hypothetical protein